jgi:hypothetical protein
MYDHWYMSANQLAVYFVLDKRDHVKSDFFLLSNHIYS